MITKITEKTAFRKTIEKQAPLSRAKEDGSQRKMGESKTDKMVQK